MQLAAYAVLLGAVCGTFAQFDDPLCAGCVVVNGAGYNKHEDCTKYVQCYQDANGIIQGHVRLCPFATYWDMESLTCQPAEKTECDVDFCSDKFVSYEYASTTNCRGSWECSDKLKSVPMCCGENEMYDEYLLTCVEDSHNTCNDTCLSVYEAPENSYVCTSFPVSGEPTKYQEEIAGWGWVVRDCPLGTLFSRTNSNCGCSSIDPKQPKKNECQPEIHLTFDRDHTDQSKFHYNVDNEFVTVKDGVAMFNGVNSRLIIHRFTNLGGTRTIVIRVNYTSPHQTFTGMAHALVVNSDCGTLPSIMVSEDGSHSYFGIGTSEAQFAYTFIPQLASEEKYVEFKFNNNKLTGSNGVEQNDVLVPGSLRNVQCALQIGSADYLQPFKGEIDDLKIFLCDPDE